MRKKVIVGLSGGVDSAVTTLLLQKQGYDVQAVFMKNWSEEDFGGPCPWAEDQASAEAVAKHLGIPLMTWNFEKEYRERVFEAMLEDYRQGRTPNPDILCNREIKFSIFFDKARQEAEVVATGHYAQTKDGHLFKGKDGSKDQSYFLAAVNSAALKHTLFPIGAMLKGDVRKMAKGAGLPNWDRPDSVGICFVGEKKMIEFLGKYIPPKPGNIISEHGDVIGHHQGLHNLTVGQRHGFGPMLDLALVKKAKLPPAQPLFVVAKDFTKNTVTVAAEERMHAFTHDSFVAEQPHWIHQPKKFPWSGSVKLRYRQADVPCTLNRAGGALHVHLHEPQRAITPGQYAVFFDGAECLGSAVIQ